MIQAGSDEILLDDSRGMASKASAVAVQVELEVWQGMHHVFQLNVDLASARKALDNAAGFLSRHWASQKAPSRPAASISATEVKVLW